MRQQRPFVVEIKQKRWLVKRPHSIWAGIDLAAITNDIAEARLKVRSLKRRLFLAKISVLGPWPPLVKQYPTPRT
ncbi:hypothetical protein X759_34525 [Mesorhizobium sp. LSHC420B00]|nr:hypothetical protein X759_34525 [Mesorhizobium sp. LSHC420B00]